MLRNCDYELAGTVLKQQYYDEHKPTELNRLIDLYIEDPCFDNAVKIIKYNDMFVFYFTESCHGGLYVRKNTSTATYETSFQHTKEVPVVKEALITNINEGITEQSEDKSKEEELDHSLKMIERFTRKENKQVNMTFKRTETADELIEQARQTVARKLAELERKIEQPSEVEQVEDQAPEAYEEVQEEAFEAVQDAMIEEVHQQEAELLDNDYLVQPVEENYEAVEDSFELFEVEAAEQEKIPLEETASTNIEELFDEELHEEVFHNKPSQTYIEESKMSKPTEDQHFNSSTSYEEEQDFNSGTAYQEEQDFNQLASTKQEVAVALDTPVDLLTLNPQETMFPNVVSTLMIDIQDLARQKEEYQAMMFKQPQDAIKYKKWSNSLEDAIEEFEAAIKVLSRFK